MPKNKGSNILGLGLVVLIILMSLLDIGANILSFVPVIGPLFETLAETLFEVITIFAAIALALINK